MILTAVHITFRPQWPDAFLSLCSHWTKHPKLQLLFGGHPAALSSGNGHLGGQDYSKSQVRVNKVQEFWSLGKAARENFSFSRRVSDVRKNWVFCDLAKRKNKSSHFSVHRKGLFHQGTGEESTASSVQGIWTLLSPARLMVLLRHAVVTQE